MENETKETIQAIIGFWIMLNFIPCLLGIIDVNTKTGCNSPIARISYVIPGHRIGCWLGSPVGEK